MFLRHPQPWLTLLIGALLGLVIRGGGRQLGTGAMLPAAGAASLVGIYLNMLIGGNMRLGMIEALPPAGFAMLWQLERMVPGPPT